MGAFLDGTPENPRRDISLAYSLNFAVDDLKAYYYEAVAAQPCNLSPTSSDLDGWFWEQTAAAKVLFAIERPVSGKWGQNAAAGGQAVTYTFGV